ASGRGARGLRDRGPPALGVARRRGRAEGGGRADAPALLCDGNVARGRGGSRLPAPRRAGDRGPRTAAAAPGARRPGRALAERSQGRANTRSREASRARSRGGHPARVLATRPGAEARTGGVVRLRLVPPVGGLLRLRRAPAPAGLRARTRCLSGDTAG